MIERIEDVPVATELYVVVEIIDRLQARVFGPFSESGPAHKLRRRRLAENVDRHPHPPQRPTVRVVPILEPQV